VTQAGIVLIAIAIAGLACTAPRQNVAAAQANPPQPGDPARGKAVFEKRCTGCHAIDADREGPRLAGVYGRKAGTVPTFDYSPALKNSGIAWSDATLNKWLTDPDVMVPQNNMSISVPKAQDRLDIIAYFKTSAPPTVPASPAPPAAPNVPGARAR